MAYITKQRRRFSPSPVYKPGDLARQVFNPGNRGQNARYDITGLPRDDRGFYDGTYHYDENGLALDRPDAYIQGLRGADDMNDWRMGQGPAYTSSSGGGGGGSFAPNTGTYGYDVARAKLAYDRAVARKNEGTQRLNKSMGFQRVGDKTQIDPYNQYGALQMLLGRQGGQLDDTWAASADRGIGHRGLGAQGESRLRFTHGAETSDLGTQYQQAYKQYLQDEADALAEYELAQQMGMYDSISGGDYDYGSGPEDEWEDYQEWVPDPSTPWDEEGLIRKKPYKATSAKKLATAVVKSKKGWSGPTSPTGDRPPKPKPAPKPAPAPNRASREGPQNKPKKKK